MPSSPNFLLQALAQSPLLFSALGVAILGKALWPVFRPAIKGRIGELVVNLGALRRLDPGAYRTYFDLYVPRPDGDGTCQIDHVVVSPFGIFVIETKNYTGWIFGGASQQTWTQCLKGGRKHPFLNPLWQNRLHVASLAQHLDLPESAFHSVVYFAGDATFKTPMPANVMQSGLKASIERPKEFFLTYPEVAQANDALEALVAGTNKRTARMDHVAAIRRRNAENQTAAQRS